MTSPDTPTASHPYRQPEWERDIYPMPAFPMLQSDDLEKLSSWYQSLGFADVFTMRNADGRPLLAHLRWSRYADILITPARSPSPAPRGLGITLNFMTESADAVAAQAAAIGATIVDGPADRPWNARDVTIVDPEGYRLNFTAASRRAGGNAESFEEVVERIRRSR